MSRADDKKQDEKTYASQVSPTFSYSKNKWVVSHINTGSWASGHSAVVVEGIDDDGSLVRSQYDIGVRTIEEENSSVNPNVKGDITKIKCFEGNNNTRNYAELKYPARSFIVEPAAVKKMVVAIHKDEQHTADAMENEIRMTQGRADLILGEDGKPKETFKFQKMGKHRFFTQETNGDNCAGFVNKWLAVAGIGDGTELPKPKFGAGQTTCTFM